MDPKISLNDITIRQAPYTERFAIAKQAGLSGVEIWIEEARQHGDFEPIIELLHRYDLRFDQSLLIRETFSADHMQNRKKILVIDVSAGLYETTYIISQPMDIPLGCNVHLAEEIKRQVESEKS